MDAIFQLILSLCGALGVYLMLRGGTRFLKALGRTHHRPPSHQPIQTAYDGFMTLVLGWCLIAVPLGMMLLIALTLLAFSMWCLWRRFFKVHHCYFGMFASTLMLIWVMVSPLEHVNLLN